MYPNLKKEMSTRGLKAQDIANVLCYSVGNVRRMLGGERSALRLFDAQIIRNRLFPGMCLDYLFWWEDKED